MGRKRNIAGSKDPYYWSKRLHYEAHRDECLAYSRRTLLAGRFHGCNKRPYTRSCELCGAKVERLGYHHWDDTNPSMGLWLCGQCHQHAEGMDVVLASPDLLAQYSNLKATVSRVYHESHLL